MSAVRQCESGKRPDGSGYGGPDIETVVTPCTALHDGSEMVDGHPDILKADIERGETEAQYVRCAEVTDHAARNQRLHDGVAVLMRDRDLGTALVGLARTAQLETFKPALDQFDEQVAEGL